MQRCLLLCVQGGRRGCRTLPRPLVLLLGVGGMQCSRLAVWEGGLGTGLRTGHSAASCWTAAVSALCAVDSSPHGYVTVLGGDAGGGDGWMEGGGGVLDYFPDKGKSY